MLIATTNPGKVREFRDMLGSDRFAWRDLSEFSGCASVAETGRSFRDNACIKASAYARKIADWTLADDSGLEVDALDGKPGIHSARWAEMHEAGRGDQANNALLLKQLEGVPGFGYDPLFLVEALGRTSAELAAADKHKISHRGQALRQLRDLLDRLAGAPAFSPLFSGKQS